MTTSRKKVVVITEDVQNVHLLLEYRPHIDVSLTCEHDPKLQEYWVCPQNMPQFYSEGIPNQAPETNKPMILNGPTSRNREGSDQLRCIIEEAEKLASKYGVHSEEYIPIRTQQLEEFLVALWTDPGADMAARRLKPLPTSKVSVTEVYSSEMPDIIVFDP
ncbi:hypothetical protein ANN_26483 [Periplaneta americana]|uniref:Uncharacterized protein n=1 Tax=Periplaneta americana TaxID=6978 RepID=A0ABQ8RYC7_PERAM|nr:hypothetical protein ANN_26483 [Periplaneta americana]